MKGFNLPYKKGFGTMFTKGATKNTPADNAVNKQEEYRGNKSSTPSLGGRNSGI